MTAKRLMPQEARKRILRYCAYQERSHRDVRAKLYEFGLRTTDVDEIMVFLIEEGFLNEERFAKAFAGGKFRLKKWGRLKITRELERHDLSANCIRIGLKEIDQEEYRKVLTDLIQRKSTQIDGNDLFVKRDKVARYTIQKGFEPELVWAQIRRLMP